MHLTQSDLDNFFGLTGLKQPVNRYPLTDIAVDKDSNIVVDIALAGFDREDITIELKGNILVIEGSKDPDERELQYEQRHISENDFSRQIIIKEDFNIGNIDAVFLKGILTIVVSRSETQKKTINIK